MARTWIFLFLFISVGLQAQTVKNSKYNFGKVKEWNNPIVEFQYSNTSGKSQLFLPVAYSLDTRVNFEKDRLAPGESTIIKVQYYTEDFGRFSRQIPIYVSTSNDPIVLKIEGNIVSLHPDAFTMCPRIDNTELQTGPSFKHGILVIDALTKEPVNDFEITLKTKTSEERIESPNSSLSITREKPDTYTMTVDKEEYELLTTKIYVNRHSPMTIIELMPYPEDQEEEEVEVEVEKEDDVIVVQPPARDSFVFMESTPTSDGPDMFEDEENPPSLKLRRTQEDEVEKEGIPSNELPTKEVEEEAVVTNDTLDFKDDGTLNTSKYAFNHIVFLIDVSGSMNRETKLPLLKYSMNQMIEVLRPEDRVSIITYSTGAQLIVSDVSGANKVELKTAIDALQAKGQSFGTEGLDMAYSIAKKKFIEDGNNEIILASDGSFNSKNFSEGKLFRKALYQNTRNEIRLSAIGFGKGRNALGFMETLSKRGNGSFITIKSRTEAETILINNLKAHSLKK